MGKSTATPIRLAPITSVSTWIEPNTATQATAPVSKPTATGTNASRARTRRRANSSTSTMPAKAMDPIHVLSAMACARPAAAYSGPPATNNSAPSARSACRAASMRADRSCGASVSKASARVSARTSTQRLSPCSACSVPLPMSYCTAPPGRSACSARRVRPSQSWSTDTSPDDENGSDNSRARRWA
ncbi:hypothetical protein D3C87_1544540 [compost metagenome]